MATLDCAGQTEYAGVVQPRTAHALVPHGAMLIDVRTTEERAAGFAPGSLAIEWRRDLAPVDAAVQFTRLLHDAAIPPNQTLLFLCRSGARSHHAATAAANVGYTHCYNIVGGVIGSGEDLGWLKADLPWMVP